MSSGRHDWGRIRQEYVEGIDVDGRIARPSLRQLAARHGVVGSKVRARAAREGWRAERGMFLDRVKEKRAAARVDALALDGAAFDRRAFEIAEGLAALAQRALRRMSGAEACPDMIQLVRLGQAARHAQALAKVALGESDPDEVPVLPTGGIAVAATTTVRVVYERMPLPEGHSR